MERRLLLDAVTPCPRRDADVSIGMTSLQGRKPLPRLSKKHVDDKTHSVWRFVQQTTSTL